MPVIAYLSDHKAETLDNVVRVALDFAEKNNDKDVEFLLAAGSSGIEAATVAWHPLGFEPVFFSEIDKSASRVLAHHYPHVPNHGDMTTIRERILSGEIEAPDMICGGPPCQSFSLAGLRNSLSDDRGNLTLEYIKICDATDHIRSTAGKGPAWILYENVPEIGTGLSSAFIAGRDRKLFAPKLNVGLMAFDM